MNAELTPKQLHYLFDELCVELGFCLPPDERVSIQTAPPKDIDDFTDAVFVAEGLDPNGNRQLRRQVREKVAKYFDHATSEPK